MGLWYKTIGNNFKNFQRAVLNCACDTNPEMKKLFQDFTGKSVQMFDLDLKNDPALS